jgi:transposase
LFESANIKIDSVVSDLFGVTGRNLIDLLLSDQAISLEAVKSCTRGKLKPKVNELYRSIKGFFNDHHRFVLESLMRTIAYLEEEIKLLHTRLQDLLSDRKDVINRLIEVPGIQENSAFAILSEIGDTLETFENSPALCSWAGVCPGNNQSAGKRKTGKIRVRGQLLKTTLVEVAWAAIKKKDSFYREKYRRLRLRRGPKKAIVAIAHKILKAVFDIIRNGNRYKELGLVHFEKKKEKTLSKLILELEKHGLKAVPA